MTPADARSLCLERSLTQTDFERFAALSGDDNPIHVDADYAARTKFGRTVAHGALLCSILRGLADRLLPGARQLSQHVMFPAPTYADEPLRFESRVVTDDGTEAQMRMRVVRRADEVVTCTVEATFLHREERAP